MSVCVQDFARAHTRALALAPVRRMRACPTCLSIYTGAVEFCGLDGTRLEETDVDPLIGVTVDRYRVERRLGQGGMACVYQAQHVELGSGVALKVLLGDVASDRQVAERFRREAQSIARIDHRNVVSVIDYGTTEAGVTFLVMELLAGCTLADAIHQAGSFPPARAAAVTRQLAAGLGAAHRLGFVHRDLKPGNVMVSVEDGVEVPRILDFGLVRVIEKAGDASDRLTKTGHTMGTPYYMAPEQVRGKECTPVSDLYALGAVLFEMIAGRAPFEGSASEVLYKHAMEPAPSPPAAGGLEILASKLLEKHPADRPQSTEAVIAALDQLGFGGASSAGVELMASIAAPGRGAQPPTVADTVLSEATLAASAWPRWMLPAIVVFAAVAVFLGVRFFNDDGAGVSVEAVATVVAPTDFNPPPPARSVDEAPVPKPPAPPAAPEPVAEPPPDRQAKRAEKKRRRAARRRRAEAPAPEAPPAEAAPEGPPVPQSKAAIRASLAEVGLSLADARALPSTRAAMSAFAQAQESRDRVAAAAAAQALVAAVQTLPLDAPFLQSRLQIVLDQLSGATGVPKKRLKALENRWFDLQVAAGKSGTDRATRAKLLREIAALSRQIRQAAR